MAAWTTVRQARLAVAFVLGACASVHALTLADTTHFSVVSTFTPSLPTPFGGLRFSADGATLYAVGAADSSSSALYSMTVTRDGTGRVAGLGSPVKVFDGAPSYPEPAGMDAGVEFGPSGTFFYTYYPSPNLAQRPLGLAGTEEESALSGVVSLAGLTFSPHRTDPGTAFGRLQVSTGVTAFIYEVPLVASATPGLFVVPNGGSLSLFAKVYSAGPPRIGGQGVTGLEYVPGGEYDGDLLYTSFADKEVWRVAVDPATGLPVGGATSPTQALFADGFASPPMGLAFDPLHPDSLFVGTWDNIVAANNTIVQIAGFDSTFASTTSSTTSTTTSTISSSSTSPSTTSTTTSPSTSSSSSSTSVPLDTTTSSTTTTSPTASSTTSSTQAPAPTSTSSTAPGSTTTSSTTHTTSSSTTTSSSSSTSSSTSTLPSTSSTTTSSSSTSSSISSTSSSPSSTSPASTSTSSTGTSSSTTSTTSISSTTTSTSSSSSSSSTSSTSTSASSSSSSTESTTTTTLAPSCDASDPGTCDDGDPCTQDVCSGQAGCEWVPLLGVPSVTCACARALPAACSGGQISARISLLSTKACTLATRAADGAPRGQRRRLVRAGRLLKKAAGAAARSTPLAEACRAALVDRLNDIRQRAQVAAGLQ